MISSTTAFQQANAVGVPLKQVQYVFTVTGAPKVFTNYSSGVAGQYPWIREIEDFQWRIQDLQGSSSIQDFAIIVNDGAWGDRTISITADRSSFTFEGATASLKLGFPGLSQTTDFITVATMTIDHLEVKDGNSAYRFVMKDNTLRALKNKIYPFGDNGRPTSSKNPKTIGAGGSAAASGNPMDILLDILQTQLLIPNAQINLTAINGYKTGLFSGYKMKFVLTSPPEAKQFIDLELMKALGGWSFQNSLGLYTPVYEIPTAATSSVMNLSENQLLDVPDVNPQGRSGGQYLINLVAYRLDYEGGRYGKYASEFSEVNASSVNQYGVANEWVIQARGARSQMGGWAMGRIVANTLTRRWGFRAPLYEIDAFLPAITLEPGDLIQLTSPKVVNPKTGKIGITNALCEVLEVKRDFKRGRVNLYLLDVSWLNTGTMGAYQVAPDGQASWPTATTAQRAQYQFVSSASTGNFSTGDPGHSIW